jgi:hypothetical protein
VETYVGAGLATDDNMIQPFRYAYWITKDTNTHSEYVLLFSKATIVMPTQLIVTLYVHLLPC